MGGLKICAKVVLTLTKFAMELCTLPFPTASNVSGILGNQKKAYFEVDAMKGMAYAIVDQTSGRVRCCCITVELTCPPDVDGT